MTPRTRTRIALVAFLLIAPMAAAQSLPSGPPGGTPLTDPPPALPAPTLPPRDTVDLEDKGFTFRGELDSPSYVRVALPDGSPALEYTLDDAGRVRIDIAGAEAISDATLVMVEGDPTGDSFTLVLMDAPGDLHRVRIDRATIQENVKWPDDIPLPAVEVLRPPAWPGAPSAPYLLNVQDSEPNHLVAGALNGASFLQNKGTHKVALQLPRVEDDFDRILLRAVHGDMSEGAVFRLAHQTDTAALYQASFLPSILGLADGDTVELHPVYERRLSPLVVEHFAEQANYSYIVDGGGPDVTLSAPDRADDFRFNLSWNGGDALSGIGGFTIDYREAGQTQYLRWMAKAAPKTATFSGDWGITYEFRATALDAVGNPSTPAYARTVVAARPAGVDDINHAPTARLLMPSAGSVVGGILQISWEAEDPDDTAVTSRLEVSTDDGLTWRLLYSGAEKQTLWDTAGEADGSRYRLRLSVSDGSQQAGDSANALTVRNIISVARTPADAPPSSDPHPVSTTPVSQNAEGAAATDKSASAEGDHTPVKKGVPAPFVGGAILAAALLARRRRG